MLSALVIGLSFRTKIPKLIDYIRPYWLILETLTLVDTDYKHTIRRRFVAIVFA